MEFSLISLIVHPSYRRKHIGMQLLYEILSDARDHAYSIVHLHLRESNLAGLALFQKIGAQIIHVLENFSSDREKVFYLELYVKETLEKLNFFSDSVNRVPDTLN